METTSLLHDPAFWLLVLFAIPLILRVPIALALGFSALVVVWQWDLGFSMLSYNFFAGIAKFPLLAIPFFILAGYIMERSGIAARIVALMEALVGSMTGGLALATLPWVIYFGVHGALGDWFTAYFYDNLFLYKGEGGGLPALAQHLWWAVRDGLPAALLLAAFLLWALLTRRFAAAGGVAALAAGLAATSLMGGYLVYYGLVLAVFAPLGLVPLVRLAEKTPAPVRTALPWAVLAACAAACYALTPNRALRGRARADLPQYRFAAQINGGSLLNYGTLDGGFYTAAGVLPPCKYFCVTNMPLDDQWTDQQAVLKAGAVDYVVALTGDLHGDFPQYAVIDRCSYDGGEGEVTWYLYQLQR